MKLKTTGPFFIAIAAILWGLDGILRRSLFTLPPITIVFYEHFIGTLIIFPFLLPALRKKAVSPRHFGSLLWISFLSSLLGTLWFTTALTKVGFISFSVVFLLQKLQPIFAVSAATLILKEKITPAYLKWAALALAAAYFVTFPGGQVNLQTGNQTALAALFAVGAAFAWGSSTAFSRFTLLEYSQTTVTGLRFLLTTIMAFFAVFILGQSPSLSAPSTSQLGRLLLISLSTGLVALWIYYKGLKLTQAKVATIIELLFPLTAVVIDIFLYKNVLALSQYLAVVVLFFAVYQVSRLNRVKSKKPKGWRAQGVPRRAPAVLKRA